MLTDQLRGWRQKELQFVMLDQLEQHADGLTLVQLVDIICGHRCWREDVWTVCRRAVTQLQADDMVVSSHTMAGPGTCYKLSAVGWLRWARKEQLANVS